MNSNSCIISVLSTLFLVPSTTSQLAERTLRQLNNNRDDNASSKSVHHIDYLYTFGAPSITLDSHQSNPDNACIPGIRVYTEDLTAQSTQCEWWQLLCEASTGTRITNVDFASQINLKHGYSHPKMSTLVLRDVDGTIEYEFMQCEDETNEHDFQLWPDVNLPSNMVPDGIHYLKTFYEARLLEIPKYVSGSLLDYVSVAYCNMPSYQDSSNCLNDYKQQTTTALDGILARGYEPFARMNHFTNIATSISSIIDDNDSAYVLRNDDDPYLRKCVVSFKGSDSVSDLTNFVFVNNDPTSFCGRDGIHGGVAYELSQIIHDSQYSASIKPALETCHEVTCVGHSLGGSLCNLFTMCANQGYGYLVGMDDESMWDDYLTLIWSKPKSEYW